MAEDLNILLVEDNPADAELIRREFKAAGRNIILRRVETKDDYENELELQGTLIDIVISDYKLPDFDSITALRILKEKNLKIPFVIVTGSINEETAVECIKAGAQDYVIKAHLVRLIPAVDSAIRGFRVELEKKYAEDKLSKSEERSKLLFENAGLPIVSLDGNGVVLLMNSVAAKYLGGKREDILGKSVYDIFPKPYAEKFHSSIKNIIETLKGCETEGKIVVSGEERWISTNMQPVVSGGNAFANVMLIIHDITEQKRINEALRESEDRYRKLVELSADGICILADGKLVFVNNAGLKLLGAQKPEDVAGKDIINFVHPDFRKSFSESIRKVYKEMVSVPSVHKEYVRLDGSLIDAEFSATYFTYKNGPAVQLVIHDITERKKAEDDLKASEEKFKAVFDSARDIVFILSGGGLISSINPAFEMLCGWDSAMWAGKDFLGLAHPDDQKNCEEVIAKCFSGEISPAFEARIITRGKGCRLFEIKLAPLFKNGVIFGVQGIAADITDRKYAEIMVRKSRDFYQKLFDELPDPMWSAGADGKSNYFNKSWFAFRGRTLEDEMKNGWHKDIHEDDRAAAIEAYRSAFEKKKPFSIQFRLKRFDGEYRRMVDHGSPFADIDEKFAGYIGIFHDITELKGTEEALRLNFRAQTVINTLLHVSLEDISLEEIFDKVLEQILMMPCLGAGSKGAIYLIDSASQTYILKALSGFPREMLTECTNIQEQSVFRKGITGPGNIEFIETYFDCCPQRYCNFPGHIYCSIPIKSAGDTLGMLLLCMRKEEDRGHEKFETINTVVEVIAGIIRRKQAEKDKKEYESHLMQSSKLAALGQMAAGVAHELNNPLTIIMGNAQYLVERGAAGNGTAKVFEEINGAAQRCSKIISSLLDFSRKKELKFQECFLSDLIEDVLHFAGNETKNNNIKIIKEYNPNLPRVNVSYSHMEQVFLNIVINAIQSMEHGGELSIKTDFSSDKNGVDISFTDHGAGIPADNISKIFNPFFTTKPKGTGLGLAISFGIIKQHGGDINVTSPGAGKGSVFTVTLPLNIIGRK